MDDTTFRSKLYDEGIIVAGGLAQYAGRMFRLGHMGNIDINDEVAVLGTIERALADCGREISYGRAIGIYLEEMNRK